MTTFSFTYFFALRFGITHSHMFPYIFRKFFSISFMALSSAQFFSLGVLQFSTSTIMYSNDTFLLVKTSISITSLMNYMLKTVKFFNLLRVLFCNHIYTFQSVIEILIWTSSEKLFNQCVLKSIISPLSHTKKSPFSCLRPKNLVY